MGSANATLCAAGTYNDQEGQSSPAACKRCPLGLYQPLPGQASCETCGPGSFSANVLSCEPCEIGAFCVGGKRVGERCPTDFTTDGRRVLFVRWRATSEAGDPAARWAWILGAARLIGDASQNTHWSSRARLCRFYIWVALERSLIT